MKKIQKVADEFDEKLVDSLLERFKEVLSGTTGRSQRVLAAVIAIAAEQLSIGELKAAIRIGAPQVFEPESLDWMGGHGGDED